MTCICRALHNCQKRLRPRDPLECEGAKLGRLPRILPRAQGLLTSGSSRLSLLRRLLPSVPSSSCSLSPSPPCPDGAAAGLREQSRRGSAWLQGKQRVTLTPRAQRSTYRIPGRHGRSPRMLRVTVLWRSCSQYKQVANNEDLPVPMENPYKEPNKKCILCGKPVDYKNVQLLSQFISPFTGCIYGRHITGLCGKKQREITKAIKRAQIMGFMPVTYKDPAYLKDPKICNIKY
ncbi:28S ribosomal protein S18c, mitochondrial [Antechinus flavipes]|uniref:28S ribosomal protein S18c, mitochondrial n=1 Tax=Antechinus flavipes TaxID=38775 RepID=UPI00223616CA|nr:28S ribosomal protein S18c, mitochondrial [Antechinus flavipes]